MISWQLLRTWCTVAALSSMVPGQAPKVLFLTHSAGFQHMVVKRMGKGKLAIAERHLIDAADGQFDVDCTQDCGVITRDNLSRYAAVVFYTTGELPVSEDNRAALIEYVRGGGGFVGIHPATDTFYKYAAYGEMIGGYFAGHPWHRDIRVIVEDQTHPATMHLGQEFEIKDEIYQFRNWSRDELHVLMRLDSNSVDITKGRRDDDDYALAWCKQVGDGRMFYTALGHRHEVWKDPRFQRHVVAGIRWAMGDEAAGAAPTGAEVLLGTGDASSWQHDNGKSCQWRLVDGALEIVPGSGSIVTTRSYRDFRLHVEFRIPPVPDGKRGQARGNSGVYLQRRYEVQVLDSFGEAAMKNGCGALYGRVAPDVNACRAPESWQSYDIEFRAARFDEDGSKTENARITVQHNGVLIHDQVELAGKTGAGRPEGAAPGPILLQDHGAPVRFRNIWILPRD